jgi:MFS transporter, ACS family, aldohexuronate transporter
VLRGRYRWVICALLFVATTINYIDRQVIGLLKPDLQHQFSWTERDYAAIVFTFQLAYAIGLLLAGRVMDKLGTKKGYTIAILLWSVAAIGHAFADFFPKLRFPTLNLDENTGISFVTLGAAAAGFALARFFLGLGEAGNFPASIKTVAEWFPRKERAFATGIFNSGTNIGALITPLVVPFFVEWWGWEGAFVATGLLGFFWLIWWLASYGPPQGHPKVSPEELALIESDPPETTTPVPWASIVKYRQTWAFALGKFLTDPVWWLYLFWIPDFLNRLYGLNVKELGWPIFTIYLITDVGSIGGGWLSSFLIKRGWSINAARKTTMLACAVAVTPIVFAPRVNNLWAAVLLVSLAASAHQGWSANLFTLVSDMFPRRAVGSVVGFGGMSGAIGGMCLTLVVGEILQRTGSYVGVFLIAGSMYLIGLAVIHLLVPRLEPAPIA